MHRITLDVNNTIYDHIMYILKNLPENLIRIRMDRAQTNLRPIQTPQNNNTIASLKSLRGVGKELYQDIDSDAYIKALRDVT